MKKIEYKNYIKQYSKELEKYQDDYNYNFYVQLAKSIYRNKMKLKNNKSIDFIVAFGLNSKYRLKNPRESQVIDIYIIGNLRNQFSSLYNVANALSDYIIEFGIMPNLKILTKNDFEKNQFDYKKVLTLSLIIYDHERNIY